MLLSIEKIKEMAGELECGFSLYIHRIDKTIQARNAEIEDLYDDDEELLSDWQIEEQRINKDIDENPDDYLIIEPLSSSGAFEIMQDFTNKLTDKQFQFLLTNILAGQKPFANFNRIIHNSDFRNDWFEFKSQAYQDYIKRAILDI